MPTTMQLISAQTLTDNNSKTVSFTNIPQTFTDLKLVVSARSTGSIQWYSVGFNNSTSSYSDKYLISSGSGVTSNSDGGQPPFAGTSTDGGYTSNTFSNSETYIPNYTGSNYKSYFGDGVSENNATEVYSGFWPDLWSNTAAITSIQITSQGSSSVKFVAGSSFYLYGISSNTTNQNTSGPYAFGGDTITTDGTYWYHTFLNSNSFTPQKNLTCDYLVVAGGGSGGGGSNGAGGGGGAGGYRTSIGGTPLNLSLNTSYTVTVGAGASGGANNTVGAKGSNSVFSTITSTGGGYGGYADVGGNGGSGGGAGNNGAGGTIFNGGTGNEGSYSPVEGYAGSKNYPYSGSSKWGGGGGGGSSQAATDATSTTGGIGGNGTSNSITGSAVTYAGGGGGGSWQQTAGTGGTGGGGNGGAGVVGGSNGTANTGGGGGGGGQDRGGGNGGSGIVIVRYAV